MESVWTVPAVRSALGKCYWLHTLVSIITTASARHRGTEEELTGRGQNEKGRREGGLSEKLRKKR